MKIAVFGADGRVGSAVVRLAEQRGHTVWKIDKATIYVEDLQTDVAIDFSAAEATKQVCDFCRMHRCPLITGVTGRNAGQQDELEKLKAELPVCESSNFSRGIAEMHKICAALAKLNWDCEIVETHRRSKRDSPSGTAKELAYTIAQNGTRKVRVHAVRVGSNFGKHEVVFATDGESVTVIHQAENVDIFARGALDEAEKLFLP